MLQKTPAIVAQGHRIASGTNPDSPYPQGSIEMQLPVFRQRGLDLTGCYPATLNLDISPNRFRIVKADYCFPGVAWTDIVAPETFSFVACQIDWDSREYDGWIYYPHPETKPRDFQPPSLIECLMPFIPDIHYGTKVTLITRSEVIEIES